MSCPGKLIGMAPLRPKVVEGALAQVMTTVKLAKRGVCASTGKRSLASLAWLGSGFGNQGDLTNKTGVIYTTTG